MKSYELKIGVAREDSGPSYHAACQRCKRTVETLCMFGDGPELTSDAVCLDCLGAAVLEYIDTIEDKAAGSITDNEPRSNS